MSCRLVSVLAADVDLVRAAGGVVRWRPSRAARRRVLYTDTRTAVVVPLCKQIEARGGRKAIEILRDLRRSGLMVVLARFFTTGHLDAADVGTSQLARVLGAPVVIGPVRAHADGAFDIARSEGQWERATDDLLRTLDAEVRLGVKPTMAHFAAGVIIDWKRRAGAPTIDSILPDVCMFSIKEGTA